MKLMGCAINFTCVAGLPVMQLSEVGCQRLHHLGLSLMLCVQVLWVFYPLQRHFGIAAQIFSECADTNVVRQACRCRLANMAVMAKKKKKKQAE